MTRNAWVWDATTAGLRRCLSLGAIGTIQHHFCVSEDTTTVTNGRNHKYSSDHSPLSGDEICIFFKSSEALRRVGMQSAHFSSVTELSGEWRREGISTFFKRSEVVRRVWRNFVLFARREAITLLVIHSFLFKFSYNFAVGVLLVF